MGAWIKDFQKSDAPQFKGKSDKERREMAMAAYLSAKRGDRNEATDNPPFTPDPPKPKAKNSDGSTTSPMSRARQLARQARDRSKEKDEGYVSHAQRKAVWANRADDGKGHPDKKKNESVEENYNWKVSHGGKDVHVKAPHAGAAVKKAQKGFGNMDLTKAKVSNLGKVGTPTNEATVDTANIKSRQAMKKSDTEKLGKLADMLAKEKKPQTEAKLDELSPATHKSYQAKAFKSGAAGMAAKRMGTMSAKDAYDNEKKRHKGIDTSKYLNRKQHGIKDSVEEAKDMYKSAAGELKDYANKNGGMDKKDFHTAAKHIENIGRANLMSKGQHLAQLSKHLRNLDTSPREKVLSVLNKHGHNVGDFMPGAKMRRESVDEAGTPERYKMIKKAGDKYNKEKKKAERDAKRAMSKDKDLMGENNIMKKRQADNEKARQALKDPSHNPAWANSKSKTEETVSELKKSTLGSYVNKAAKDAASKAYGAASAAKDNNIEKGGKDFSKSMKRLRGIDTATKKLAKEDTNEAKSFDQKFRDHLKFSMSKSPAVQAYMKKRRDDRDARHAKQDPAAVKKNYGPAVIPPGTAYNKASKRGMNPSQAANAVSTAFKNRAKRGGKLPK
jgi:hypothetical protein